MSYKTVNRGWLKRQIQAGNVRAKCDFHYTDDYAWDDAVNFQRTDWMPAYFNPPQVWEEITLPNGNKSHRCTNNHERNPQGYISFNDHDLDSTSGRAHWDEDGKTIKLSVHSNLSFSLQLVKPVKSDGTHKKAKAPANTPKAAPAPARRPMLALDWLKSTNNAYYNCHA